VFSCSQVNSTSLSSHLYLLRPDGSGSLMLTENDDVALSPAWSSTGHWILYTDGSRFIRITPDGELLEEELDKLTFQNITRVAISPVGNRLAFVVTYPSNVSTIYIYSINGENIYSVNVQEVVTHLGWFPDGVTIAFSTLRNSGRPAGIYSLDSERARIDFIKHELGSINGLSISKFSQLIYTILNNSISTLFIFDLPTKRIQIAEPTMYGTTPSWSPDGSSIVYTGFSTEDGNSVYIRASDGATTSIASQLDCYPSNPQWYSYSEVSQQHSR
jgi:Tol biopolymer transport system component